MSHVPMCYWCGVVEVGSVIGSDRFCSCDCEEAYQEALDEMEAYDNDPHTRDDRDWDR